MPVPEPTAAERATAESIMGDVTSWDRHLANEVAHALAAQRHALTEATPERVGLVGSRILACLNGYLAPGDAAKAVLLALREEN